MILIIKLHVNIPKEFYDIGKCYLFCFSYGILLYHIMKLISCGSVSGEILEEFSKMLARLFLKTESNKQ